MQHDGVTYRMRYAPGFALRKASRAIDRAAGDTTGAVHMLAVREAVRVTAYAADKELRRRWLENGVVLMSARPVCGRASGKYSGYETVGDVTCLDCLRKVRTYSGRYDT